MTQVVKYHSLGLGLEPQSADPIAPSQGQLQYSDGTVREEGLWQFDGTNWVRVGGGSSGINYVDGFENTVDWVSSDITKININENTTNAQRGTKDVEIIKEAAISGLNEYASYAFTIDRADRGKILPIKADYITGANVLDDDFEIVIYDVTNAIELPVTNEFIKLSPPAGLSKRLDQTSFQTADDSVSYELRIYVRRNTTSELSLFVDDLSVGPDQVLETGAQIFFRVARATTQNIADSADITVQYNVVQEDSFSAYDIGTFEYVIPVTGLYEINARADLTGANTNGNVRSIFFIDVNNSGSIETILDTAPGNGSGNYTLFSMNGTIKKRFTVGDRIEIKINQNTGATRSTAGAEANNYWEILKIGN
jgi:hypothetical protein